MIIEQSPLIDGWRSSQQIKYRHFAKPATVNGINIMVQQHQVYSYNYSIATNDL